MLKRFALLATAVAALAGCGSSAAATTTPPALTHPPAPVGNRPSSPAHIWFISPTANETVTGPVLHIDIGISGAQLTTSVSTHISPTLGHIHLVHQQQSDLHELQAHPRPAGGTGTDVRDLRGVRRHRPLSVQSAHHHADDLRARRGLTAAVSRGIIRHHSSSAWSRSHGDVDPLTRFPLPSTVSAINAAHEARS
jgi:hypothetical protein